MNHSLLTLPPLLLLCDLLPTCTQSKWEEDGQLAGEGGGQHGQVEKILTLKTLCVNPKPSSLTDQLVLS